MRKRREKVVNRINQEQDDLLAQSQGEKARHEESESFTHL